MLFLALWEYLTSSRNVIGFTPFHLAYGLEAVLPIECEIPSLKLVMKLIPKTFTDEEHFLYFSCLDEHHR